MPFLVFDVWSILIVGGVSFKIISILYKSIIVRRCIYWDMLLRAQRLLLLTMMCGYCTISGEAILVIAGVKLIDLFASESNDMLLRRLATQYPKPSEKV